MTKRVLITGVSSGIGLAQARLFLRNGFTVYGVDKAKKPDLSGDFQFLQLDITGDLAELFEMVPRVDVLCHTAGVLDAYKPLLDTTQADFEALFQVNFFAAVRITRHYLAQMLTAQSGIIINMCSIASFMAGGGGAAYTSSKHALAGFTRQLALDYAKAGIQVFGIAPGAVQTAMTATDFEPGGLAQWVADETPIGRWLRAEEIAELTMFLASGKASAMQGEIVKIDGGWSLK
ncbi:TPA: 3-oxoacyl-ACP reductase [Streptococcus equi subsp. zooepidemicus]|uniref:3-ketoacyl-(Acyl-carrier-protein) reductase n=5 Tax=Streptococcus equi subsp. zooepidemicus TaxID=40041 RepID=B4U494_STREM|nr:3-oxoacyl-ACP reductase [Streptococcus equi]KIS12093.1 3-ketoacyl-ACP reductase [Streptococcus equi subsp. zooepidemicus Sz105]KIS16789.1 3-ketoacyl-ACP reductase [Streptococcus equi subsp. zooepidemicus Sz4is]VED86048.1 3-ketoacyl-ACP reductase [Streptococcus equi subsp. equi]ACG62811.1 3-ketoacyl-(acyl-carrier-protein) reductase [Streptococcus equi subsp. zooepidemicus MGCS10565]AEJ25824.1 3-ketoacyl-(acyl-carrier-protein) reductase [Streptococcus equi subsp. zooepidemicus ATCC 35246]